MPAFLAAVFGSSIFKSIVVGGGIHIASRLFFDRREKDRLGVERPNEVTIRTGAQPAQWVLGRAKVQGVVTYATVKGNQLHMAIALSEGDCELIEAIFIDDEEIPLGRNPGTYEMVPTNKEEDVRFRLFDYLDDGDPFKGKTLREVDPLFTEQYMGKGISWVHLQLDGAFFEEIPKVEFLLCGIKIRWPGNPRKLWTDSAAALRYWFLTERVGVPIDNIDRDSVIRAHEICSETITYTLPHPLNVHYSGYSTRYACNGVLKATDSVKTVNNEMDFCWFGDVTNNNGVLSFHPGESQEAEWIVGKEDIIEMVSMVTDVSDRDKVSAITVSADALRENRYLPASTQVIDQDAFDIIGKKSKDLGSRKFVTDGMQLSRNADLVLRDDLRYKRWEYRLRAGENMKNLGIRAGSTGVLHDPSAGLNGQRLRAISTSISPDFTVTVTLKEDIDWRVRFVSPPEIQDPVSEVSGQLPEYEPEDFNPDDTDSGEFSI